MLLRAIAWQFHHAKLKRDEIATSPQRVFPAAPRNYTLGILA